MAGYAARRQDPLTVVEVIDKTYPLSGQRRHLVSPLREGNSQDCIYGPYGTHTCQPRGRGRVRAIPTTILSLSGMARPRRQSGKISRLPYPPLHPEPLLPIAGSIAKPPWFLFIRWRPTPTKTFLALAGQLPSKMTTVAGTYTLCGSSILSGVGSSRCKIARARSAISSRVSSGRCHCILSVTAFFFLSPGSQVVSVEALLRSTGIICKQQTRSAGCRENAKRVIHAGLVFSFGWLIVAVWLHSLFSSQGYEALAGIDSLPKPKTTQSSIHIRHCRSNLSILHLIGSSATNIDSDSYLNLNCIVGSSTTPAATSLRVWVEDQLESGAKGRIRNGAYHFRLLHLGLEGCHHHRYRTDDEDQHRHATEGHARLASVKLVTAPSAL